MNPLPQGISLDDLVEKLGAQIMNMAFRVSTCMCLAEGPPKETDLSTLTPQEILRKINEFVDSDHSDEKFQIFLQYLAKYPVSMCKRTVSTNLKALIGFHYRLGAMVKKEHKDIIKPVSMDELAEIFGRSKATIHDYIAETESLWSDFLEFSKRHREAEAIAKRELIEEAKERLREKRQAEQTL